MNRRILMIFILFASVWVVEVSAQSTIQSIAGNMVRVYGGTFMMGCTTEQGTDCYDDERPTHGVTVRSFSLSRFEVSQSQYQAIMGSNPSYHKHCADCPIENVSWNETQEFTKKLNSSSGKNYRLPTEAEWEYAARGGKMSKGTKYSGRNDVSKVAWVDTGQTYVIGLKLPNELGFYDMSGNVWEWCSDWYSDAYYKISTSDNPKGPERGERKVLRGGSWNNVGLYSRISVRGDEDPSNRNREHGFRLAQD